MRVEGGVAARALRQERIEADLVVVGGGLPGLCAAVTACRRGLRVVLCGDRPVLGGNSSSEVRLWGLGATSHMGNNNRWAREGGVIDELLCENLWRNPEGNPLIWDTILLEWAWNEPGLTLLLNTAAYAVDKADADTIAAVRAFCSQNQTEYELRAPLFCDASGDGVVGFLAGAAFRMGAESADEFGEKFAPDEAYGELLGHSMYFYSKDLGRPVSYTPPSFAHRNIPDLVPRYRAFDAGTFGCRLWWIEYGGRLDTIADSEAIRWELWRVVYGVWDYIKNSGRFPEAETLTLEWVSTIPGKRESRRFEGDLWLTQPDLIEQRRHDDDVAHGGWSIDLHPADGVFSERPGCNQWHSRGVYPIPYRCLYSRNVTNLFLAGRIISATHVAFGSTRVMLTGAVAAQAVGEAAALCREHGVLPRAAADGELLRQLQGNLISGGQHIPFLSAPALDDLAQSATVTASSSLRLASLPADGPWRALTQPVAQMIPVTAGQMPAVTLWLRAEQAGTTVVELLTSDQPDNHTPDRLLSRCDVALEAGEHAVTIDFGADIDAPRYVFVAVQATPGVAVRTSEQRLTGVLSVVRRRRQEPDGDIGVEAYDMWCPDRRPGGQSLAFELGSALAVFEPEQVLTAIERPTSGPNAWVADPADPAPTLTLTWPTQQAVSGVSLCFDTDFDHAMETVLMGHPERVAPFCVRAYRLLDDAGNLLAEVADNHQTRRIHRFEPAVETSRLRLEVTATWGAPAAVFRCLVS